MNVESVEIGSITHDPSNVRRHDERNLQAIRGSLARFGQQKPIVVDADGIVRAGNGTLTAAKMLGWTHVDIVRTDLRGSEATAYAIADNRSSELAEWDDEALARQLAALQIDDEALANATGFDAKEIAALVSLPDVVEDEVPEPPVDPVTKPGDLWLLGDHRLMCGDSTRKDDVVRSMAGLTADITITDPLYGIGYEYADHDDSDNDKNASLVESAFSFGAQCKVWTPGLRNLGRDITRFGITRVAVWFKKFAAAGNGMGGASVWEPILIAGKPPVVSLKSDVIECMTDREMLEGKSLRDLHSCPKPVRLYATLIESFTSLGHVIHEPFCGSGTTLIAAEQLGRRCCGLEISPAYCDVIVQRWETLTGGKARLSS